MCGSRAKPEDLHAVRIAAGGANLVLGCDMVVAAAPAALSRIEPGVTQRGDQRPRDQPIGGLRR